MLGSGYRDTLDRPSARHHETVDVKAGISPGRIGKAQVHSVALREHQSPLRKRVRGNGRHDMATDLR